ncbi:MAG: hypothetical protein WDN45_05450 [Caulobacteraceae bacterium]
MSLLFPASAKPLRRARRARAPGRDGAGAGNRASVEDDESVAAAVSAMLRELGYRVIRAADGPERPDDSRPGPRADRPGVLGHGHAGDHGRRGPGRGDPADVGRTCRWC